MGLAVSNAEPYAGADGMNSRTHRQRLWASVSGLLKAFRGSALMKYGSRTLKVVIVVVFASTVYRIYIAKHACPLDLVLSTVAILAAGLISVREQREHWRRLRAAAKPNKAAPGDGPDGGVQ
jgi:hypothetical protein